MSNETITIENVDAELLDRQRLSLAEYLRVHEKSISPEHRDDLTGILNMLDAWHDAIWSGLPVVNSKWIPKEDAAYPKNVITVIGRARDNQSILFSFDGYCQVRLVAREEFLDRFRSVTDAERAQNIPPELAYFNMDDMPMILGFSYGDRWNGWGRPYLEKESLRHWLEATGDMFDPDYPHMKFAGDVLIYHDPDAAADGLPVDQVLPPVQLEYQGKTYTVYDVANGWCWNQYALATSESVDFSAGDDLFKIAYVPAGLEAHHAAFINQNAEQE